MQLPAIYDKKNNELKEVGKCFFLNESSLFLFIFSDL